MKKILLAFGLFTFMLAANAQEQTYINLNKDTSGKYLFEKITVRSYETRSDTIRGDFFPEVALDSAQLKSYLESLIAQRIEAANEQRRIFNLRKAEADLFVGFYDGTQGDGAWLALQKSQILQSLQGSWQLIERNGETVRFDITINNLNFRRNAQRFGTITVTDDLSFTLTGFYNFDLTFTATQAGWRAERGNRTLSYGNEKAT